jgi:hypothetical protein
MIFGSWVYNSDELTLDYFENMRNVDLHDYVPSGIRKRTFCSLNLWIFNKVN